MWIYSRVVRSQNLHSTNRALFPAGSPIGRTCTVGSLDNGDVLSELGTYAL